MAQQRLTAQIAFKAAHQLSWERQEVNSNTLWLRCGGIGSRGTAKKWAELWNAFEGGEEVGSKFEQYRSVYEAVKRGEEIVEGEGAGVFEEDEVIPQIEGAVGSLAQTLSAIVSELVEEKTREIAESYTALAQCEQERGRRATEAVSGLEKELSEALQRIELLENQNTSIREGNRELEGRNKELSTQLQELQRQREALEADNRELSRHLGEAAEREASLKRELGESQEKINNFQQKQDKLHEELTATQREGKAYEAKLRELERDKAICEARKADLERELEREFRRTLELEERCNTAFTQLVEKEGKAATALEKARQLEAQLEATKEELRLALVPPKERLPKGQRRSRSQTEE